MVSRWTDAPVPLGQYVPTADERIVFRGVGWAGFQALLALRDERRRPRMAYLDGAVELMAPSRGHEACKANLGRLVEAYCTEREIVWTPYGSWLLDDESERAGAEPDECYVFGPDPKRKARPDLVIEIVWTSGGLNKLEIYRRLGIEEVWFWKHDAISVFVLGDGGYEPRATSSCLPGLDLPMLCELAAIDTTSEAVQQLRQRLRR